ncbi:MAG: D-alanyl-D-alanine carboxypeptidase family protein [Solirubrobacterales bacterium]
MKVWVATGAVLLVACAAVVLLLVDPNLWTSPADRGDHSTDRVVDRRAPQDALRRQRRHHAATLPDSPYALAPAGRHPPVDVDFAPGNEPRAGVLFDVDTGRVLWRHDAGKQLPIASLTKMMTALIIARRHKPDEPVLITPQALAYEGSGVGVLPKGEKVPLKDLFYGLLLVSGNDAAIALAQHDAGTVGAFVRRMNAWRKRFGLRCSRFSTPSGILDQGNYSCPMDLAALARADLENPWIRRVVATREARFPFPIKGNFLDLYNNNPFIIEGMEGITGLKTGYTDAAGRCYVITQRVAGHELGVVLLNTPNPLDQVPALLHAGAKFESRQDGKPG